jgi:TP901 family phage tail tape measure protein
MARGKSSVISVLITGDSAGLSKAVGDADSRLAKFGKVAGAAVAAAGAAVAGFAALSVREFAKFDAAMQQSVAIMGDVSDALRKDMSDAARQVAKTTTFSAEQAAESYFFLASAGLDAEASIAAMPKVAAFAQAGMFDMARATDLLTDAQSALGMVIRDDAVANMEQMVRLSDVLVKANTLANASVEQFSTALTTKAGAALRALNKDMEEGVAVLAAFADQGIKGELAGTQFSIVLRDLTTKALQNEDAFRKFNVRVFDADGNMRNMADIVSDLEGALDGMSDATAKATLLQMGFSDKSLGALMALMGTSEQIRIYEAALRDAGGVTDEIANKQLQTFTAQMSLLKSQFLDVAIEIGSALVPALSSIVEWLQSKGPAFSAWAEEAGEKISTFIATVGEKAQQFKAFFDERLREPVERVKEAIGTFVSESRARLQEFSDAVPGAVKAFTDFIAEVRALADDPAALGERLGQALAGALVRALEELKGMSARIGMAVRDLFAKVDWMKLGIDSSTFLIQFGIGLGAGILSLNWLGPLARSIIDNWQVVLAGVLTIMFAPGKFIAKLGQLLARIPFVGRLGQWIVLSLNGVGGSVLRWLTDFILSPFITGFRFIMNLMGPSVGASMRSMLMAVPNAIRSLWDDISLQLFYLFERFGRWVATLGFAQARLAFSLWRTRVVSYIKSLFDDFVNVGKDIVLGFIEGIKSMGSAVARAFRNLIDDGINAAKRFLGISSPSKVFMGLGEEVGAGFALGIKNTEGLVTAASAFMGTAASTSVMSSGMGGLSPQPAASIVINVTGALDAEGVARQIERVLRDSRRRTGGVLV